jgi:hypothetical protein
MNFNSPIPVGKEDRNSKKTDRAKRWLVRLSGEKESRVVVDALVKAGLLAAHPPKQYEQEFSIEDSQISVLIEIIRLAGIDYLSLQPVSWIVSIYLGNNGAGYVDQSKARAEYPKARAESHIPINKDDGF